MRGIRINNLGQLSGIQLQTEFWEWVQKTMKKNQQEGQEKGRSRAVGWFWREEGWGEGGEDEKEVQEDFNNIIFYEINV